MPDHRPSGPPDAPEVVLLTGAAGAVGSLLTKPLSAAFRVRLADLRDPGAGSTETVTGDLADPKIARHAVDGVDAVVHLAGIPRPDAAWDDLARANLAATASVLDAAALQGVSRIVFASSVHVTGGYGDPADWPVDPQRPARPCCRYGVSKAAVELLLRTHADRHPGVAAVALRFGLVAALPRWNQEVRGWTPLPDVAPFVLGALRAQPGYQVHFAVTAVANPRYVTAGLRAGIGHDSRAETYLTGPVGDVAPAYADGCRLWPDRTRGITSA